eukprot:CAMPEP_0201198038 /NCGR_PEP_ID=MMETSP0851-20130426/155934_1 /ASSEMBLY_ACC=CAM_ASM_000631 /TAXON_ID=183588 /ORGANISM="Pseudo-nitzschia fraudulenta, Strain WWA7" /LENGTH=111 /DNA_ID=CAMNT_0047485245 /DNA_START=71 /DNA_END=403 /DNA_ORIENTATION=-
MSETTPSFVAAVISEKMVNEDLKETIKQLKKLRWSVEITDDSGEIVYYYLDSLASGYHEGESWILPLREDENSGWIGKIPTSGSRLLIKFIQVDMQWHPPGFVHQPDTMAG